MLDGVNMEENKKIFGRGKNKVHVTVVGSCSGR